MRLDLAAPRAHGVDGAKEDSGHVRRVKGHIDTVLLNLRVVRNEVQRVPLAAAELPEGAQGLADVLAVLALDEKLHGVCI